MANKVLIPAPLSPFTGGRQAVEVEGETVGEILANLLATYGELRQHLVAPDGRLRPFVGIFVNDENVRYLENEQTPVHPGDVISIVPSVAGGAL